MRNAVVIFDLCILPPTARRAQSQICDLKPADALFPTLKKEVRELDAGPRVIETSRCLDSLDQPKNCNQNHGGHRPVRTSRGRHLVPDDDTYQQQERGKPRVKQILKDIGIEVDRLAIGRDRGDALIV